MADSGGVSGTPRRSRFRARRTWPQRSLLALNCLTVAACFTGASGLMVARHFAKDVQRVELPELSSRPIGATQASGPTAGTATIEGTTTTATTGAPVPTHPGDAAPTTAAPINLPVVLPDEPFPTADPAAENFLITGADNNECIDPDSPYAGAFGDRMGERSDTIMVMRVDPVNHLAAILSFPRDLWVKIGSRHGRLNETYVRDDPRKLRETIVDNFGIGTDHFIQIDFCAFKLLVEAVDGVAVPFDYPAMDSHTGLDVPQAGCFTFDGDHALAYVRSRHYHYFKDGKWKEDPAADLGRITRQQDFIRRALTAALDKGVWDVEVATGLIKIVTQNMVFDTRLSFEDMLSFAGLLRDFDPGTIRTYQIESRPERIADQDILLPKLNGQNMQAILHIFQGIAPLAGAPEQVFEMTTTTTSAPGSTASGATTSSGATVASVETSSTPPTVPEPEENTPGIAPPDGDC